MRKLPESSREPDNAECSVRPPTSKPLADPAALDPRIDRYLDQIFEPLNGRIESLQQQEMRSELVLHLAALVEAHLELGSSPEEAVRAALEQLGDPRRLAREFAAEWQRPTGSDLPLLAMVPCALAFATASFFGTLGLMLALQQIGGDSLRVPVEGPGIPLTAGFLVGLWRGRHPLGSRWGLLAIGMLSLLVSSQISSGGELLGQSFRGIHLLMSMVVACGTAGLGMLIRNCQDRLSRRVAG
jgi:hypothetical protein